MDRVQLSQLRKTGKLQYKVLDGVEKLAPVAVHDELGTLYKGCILATDDYGLYTAVVGTTDQLLKTSPDETGDNPTYKVLKVSNNISNVRFLREDRTVVTTAATVRHGEPATHRRANLAEIK